MAAYPDSSNPSSMSPCESPPNIEQPAGLSTAESDCGSSMTGSETKSLFAAEPQSPISAVKVSIPNSPPPPPSNRGRNGLLNSSRRNGSDLNQSISNSAPTILIHTPSNSSNDESSSPVGRPLRSVMSSRTLHESLHKKYGENKPAPLQRTVSFTKVDIREYERVLGDNPSVRTGPPLSIGWRYAPNPISMDLNAFEEGKGSPRVSSEFLVPKNVRETMLKEHADISRREMVTAVREVMKEKSRRRNTVTNLHMQKSEEKVERVKRKIKKIIKRRPSYETAQAQLWDEAHAIAMEKAKRLEDSLKRGESVSRSSLYSVGTPCDNTLPSRRNTIIGTGGSLRRLEEGLEALKKEDARRNTHTSGQFRRVECVEEDEKGKETGAAKGTAALEESDGDLDKSYEEFEKLVKQSSQQLHRLSEGAAENDEVLDKALDGEVGGVRRRGSNRGSGNIVASEDDAVEEIFAKLFLDSESAREGTNSLDASNRS